MDPITALLIMAVLAGAIAGSFVFLSAILGPKKRTPLKDEPFECGVESDGMVKDMGQISRSLVACPKHKGIVDNERNTNFPETSKFVQTHAKAIRAIGKAAFTRLTEEHPDWVEGHFAETPILTAEEVQQLFEANKPDAPLGEGKATSG